MKIKLIELFDKTSWTKSYNFLGISECCLNKRPANGDGIIELTEEEAKKIGLKK
jgi:hypothetical protein